jgi:uncharacterized protein YndB with AHSA1/START domain
MTAESTPSLPLSPEPVARKSGILGVIKMVLIGLAVIVAVFAGIVAMQPDEFRIVRSRTIDAPAAKVFPFVNDFHQWESWSPWAKLDPNAKNTFEGPSEGEGAIFSWDGNDEVGSGRMTIMESRPDELVKIKLEFFRPMEDTSTTEFTFQPEGDKTVVTWSMAGRNNFIGKAFCLLMNMDKVVGGQFDEGLANMNMAVAASK